jgi:hypothetical protein
VNTLPESVPTSIELYTAFRSSLVIALAFYGGNKYLNYKKEQTLNSSEEKETVEVSTNTNACLGFCGV